MVPMHVLSLIVAAMCCLAHVHGFVRILPPRPVVGGVPSRVVAPFVRPTAAKTFFTHAAASSKTTSALTATAFADVLDRATKLFPAWVMALSFLGVKQPRLFDWFRPLITPALALTMLCMGMSLTVDDFKRVAKKPQYVGLGFLVQYTVMPLTAAAVSRALGLGPELAAGLILVGCAPGGTASNLVTLIAGADVALSVLMTAVSTVAAVVMTPLLTSWLAGSYVAVKASDLVLSTLQVTPFPVPLCLRTKHRPLGTKHGPLNHPAPPLPHTPLYLRPAGGAGARRGGSRDQHVAAAGVRGLSLSSLPRLALLPSLSTLPQVSSAVAPSTPPLSVLLVATICGTIAGAPPSPSPHTRPAIPNITTQRPSQPPPFPSPFPSLFSSSQRRTATWPWARRPPGSSRASSPCTRSASCWATACPRPWARARHGPARSASRRACKTARWRWFSRSISRTRPCPRSPAPSVPRCTA